jgi:hypothetical protein
MMQKFNDKHFVFVISAGRTGTKYFGTVLQETIDNSFSVHEPDVLSGVNKRLIGQVKDFGFYNMIPGRLLGKTGIRTLSEKFLGGHISEKELSKSVVSHRKKYYESIPKELVIESYYGWYGCIPAIRKLFKNYRVIVVARDPRDWVTSNVNWKEWYGKDDWVSRLKAGRINPSLVGDKQYAQKWDGFDRFQKLCWAYSYIYNTMLDQVEQDDHIQLFKYEDLFQGPERYDTLGKLLGFITKYDDKNFHFNAQDGLLERRIHKNSSDQFPKHSEWSEIQLEQYWEICGDIHTRLNYPR